MRRRTAIEVVQPGRVRSPRPIPPALSAAPFSARTATMSIGRGTLTGPSYRRLTCGAYVVAGTEISHGRMVQAMRTVLPQEAVLRGWSAAWALGVRWAGAADPVEVALAHTRRVRRRSGLLVTGEVLHPSEVVGTDLGPATSPARTAFDLARRLPEDQAVAAMDALLRAAGALADEVFTVAQRHLRSSGRSRALAAARLADPRSESPRESLLRLAVVRAGLPAPVPQYEVRVGGRFVARLDLAWPQLRVALEYDGAHHRNRRQYGRDLARHNALRAAGWVVFQVDAAQWPGLDAVLRSVADVLGARA